MALVDSHHFTEHLHGSIEMIEDRTQIEPVQRREGGEKTSSQILEREATMGEKRKDGSVFVTVTASAASRHNSFSSSKPAADDENEHTTPINDDPTPVVNSEANRRYSLIMASLAAARVEECKANLRRNSTASLGGSAGMSAGTAKGGWDWKPRRDFEEDFSVREQYFADEL